MMPKIRPCSHLQLFCRDSHPPAGPVNFEDDGRRRCIGAKRLSHLNDIFGKTPAKGLLSYRLKNREKFKDSNCLRKTKCVPRSDAFPPGLGTLLGAFSCAGGRQGRFYPIANIVPHSGDLSTFSRLSSHFPKRLSGPATFLFLAIRRRTVPLDTLLCIGWSSVLSTISLSGNSEGVDFGPKS